MAEAAEAFVPRATLVSEAAQIIGNGYQLLRSELLLVQASPDGSQEFRRHFEQAQATYKQVQILEALVGRLEP